MSKKGHFGGRINSKIARIKLNSTAIRELSIEPLGLAKALALNC
jgi:hypothetical protein